MRTQTQLAILIQMDARLYFLALVAEDEYAVSYVATMGIAWITRRILDRHYFIFILVPRVPAAVGEGIDPGMHLGGYTNEVYSF